MNNDICIAHFPYICNSTHDQEEVYNVDLLKKHSQQVNMYIYEAELESPFYCIIQVWSS